MFSAILSWCRFGDQALLFSGCTAMVLVFQASFFRLFLVIFFFTPPTDPKPGNIFDAKRTKRGWPQVSLMVSFCFVLFLFFSVGEINWNWHCLKTLYIPFGDSQVRIKKVKRAMIYWPQRHWGGVRARYCASVHSCAVKWSRKTKGKTSRHQASFKMGVIVSSCSWSWFKVLTSMYVARTCFTRTFPQLRSPPSPCQPCDKWYTSQKQREDISDLPFPLPPKVPDWTVLKPLPTPCPDGWTCS